MEEEWSREEELLVLCSLLDGRSGMKRDLRLLDDLSARL